MSDNKDYVERTTEGPTVVRREEVRVVRNSNTGWWIALAIAVVAVIGAFFYFNANQNAPADLQAARDQGAAQAQLNDAAANAQLSASQAAQSAQAAGASLAGTTRDAANAADDRSASAADAARDAAATEPAPNPPPR